MEQFLFSFLKSLSLGLMIDFKVVSPYSLLFSKTNMNVSKKCNFPQAGFGG